MTEVFILCIVLLKGEAEMCIPVISPEACHQVEHNLDIRFVEYSRCDTYTWGVQ